MYSSGEWSPRVDSGQTPLAACASSLLLSEKPLHFHTLRVYYSTPYYDDLNSEILATNIGSSSFLGLLDVFLLCHFFHPALACLEAALALCGGSTLFWRHTLRALCCCRRSKRQFTPNNGDGYKRRRDGSVRGGVPGGLGAGYASRQRVYTEVVSFPFQVS